MDPKLPEDFQPVADPLPDDSDRKGVNASELSGGTDESLDSQPTEAISAEEAGLTSAGEPDADWEEFSEEDIEDSEAAEEPLEATGASSAEPAPESLEGNPSEDKQADGPAWAERLLDLLEAEVKVQDRAANSVQVPAAEEGETPTEIIHGPIEDPGLQPPLRQPSGTVELPLPSEHPSSADTSSGNNTQPSGDENIGYGTVTVVTNQEGSEIGHPLPRIYVAVELLNARQLYEQARHDTAQLLQTTLVKIADNRIDFWFWQHRNSERASDRFGR